MRADLYTGFLRLPDGLLHRQRIRCMKSAGDVSGRDVAQHFRVVSHGIGAEGFSEIAVDIDVLHRISPKSSNVTGTKRIFFPGPSCASSGRSAERTVPIFA